ncbi:MAG: carboxypeptidase T [Polaribacter sp.]|jgi:carboxypeptidase T
MRFIITRLIPFIFFMAGIIETSIASNSNVVQKGIFNVVAPNEIMKNKLYITFHNQLLDSAQNKILLELSLQEQSNLLGLGFKLEEVDKSEIKKTIIVHAKNDVAGISGYSCYQTVEETYTSAEDLVVQYSELAEWIDIGDSWQKTTGLNGYDLNVLKITNQGIVKDKPVLFIQSAMHAREYTTAALTLDFAEDLLFNYSRRADVKWILDHHEVHILFHVNPDGRKQAEKGLSWRKNTNTAYCSETSDVRGADLNRNFSFTWAQSENGSSAFECDLDYRGGGPASEPEINSVETYIKSIFEDYRGEGINDASAENVQGIHLDIHSYSRLILWPWGHTENLAPNAEGLERLGRRLAYWNNYAPMQSIGLYATDGTSESISYGELGIPQFTFELGNSFFEPCSNYINTIKPDNLPALYYAAKSVAAPLQLPFGPDIHSLTLNGNDNANIESSENLMIAGIAEDGLYNAVGAVLDVNNITGVSVYIDIPPWEINAQPISVSATDGNFDSYQENFEVNIDTTGLSVGQHIIYVQGKNTRSQVGVVSAAFLIIGEHNNLEPNVNLITDCEQQVCQFDASLTTDDGFISHYEWDFGDGTINSENKNKLTKNYSSEDEFDINLTVTDDFGIQILHVVAIKISAKPTPNFTVECDFLNCTFNAESSSDLSGDIVDYQWNLSDGTQYTSEIVNHVFAQEGSYTVTLTAVDDESETNSIAKGVNVIDETEVPVKSSGGGSLNLTFFGMLFFIRRIRKLEVRF